MRVWGECGECRAGKAVARLLGCRRAGLCRGCVGARLRLTEAGRFVNISSLRPRLEERCCDVQAVMRAATQKDNRRGSLQRGWEAGDWAGRSLSVPGVE